MPPTRLQLRSLTPADEAAFRAAYGAWDPATSNGHIFARGFEAAAPFLAYLAMVEKHRLGQELPEGFVAYTSLFAFVGSEMAGMLTIRHELNDFLLRIGGHIGYAVTPPHRRKGYATEMLRKALPFALALGIRRALVTCDEPNVASAKTIEACGGVLEDRTAMGPGLPPKRRYWIEIAAT